jgi:cytochrome c biogenesis protein CcmG, thiol:disulfide interchange protein DsbE
MLRRVLPLFLGFVLALCSPAARADTADFALRDLDGKLVKLADLLENGPVLISFWATYCEPCKKEIPHLIEIEKEFAAEALQLVLISVDSPRSQKGVKPFVKGRGWECPVLLDPNGQTMKKLKGTAPPYTMIVGTSGEVLAAHSGYTDGAEKKLRAEIATLLRGGDGE